MPRGLPRWLPLLAASALLAQGQDAALDAVTGDSDLDPLRNLLLGGSRQPAQSALQAWLGALIVPIPAGKSGELPLGMGNLTLTGGTCWGLRIGSLKSEDRSKGEVLEYEVDVSDFEITCHVEADSMGGDLQINITVGPSSLDLSARVEPATSFMAPEYPLPLGAMNLTSCSADLVVTNASFGGRSQIVTMTSYMPPDMLAGMIGGFINDPLCEGLQSVIAEKGAAAAQMGLGMLGSLLMDPWPLEEPEPLTEVVAWDHYPPLQVLQAMIHERFHVWADRVISIMNVRTFRAPIAADENFTVVFRDFQVEGRGPRSHPGLDLQTEDENIVVQTDLHSLMLRTTLGIEVTLPNEPVLHEYVSIRLGLDNFTLGVRALVDAQKLGKLEMDQVMESPQCLFNCMEGTTEPRSEALAITKMGIAMRPLLHIDSPGSLEVSITHFINDVIASLFAGYMPTMNRLLNGALAMARHPLNQFMWKKIEAQPPCGRTNMMMGVSEDVIHGLWSTSLAFIGAGLLAAFIVGFIRPNFARSPAISAPEQAVEGTEPAEVAAAAGAAGVTVAVAPDADATQPAPAPKERRLAGEPTVPSFLAVFYPFAIVGAVFLFLFADLDVGATVSINTRAQGSEAMVGPIFSFSLLSTVVHSWNSGAYVISLITLGTSGIWPFVKLSLLLVCWLAPPSCCSLKARGRILGFLDTWGKYSYVDSWFLVLSMSAFALDWRGVGNTSMKVQTVPTAAFYAYFGATSLSICLGLIASHQHHKALAFAKEVQDPEGTQARRVAADLAKPERLCRLLESRRKRVAVTAALGVTALLAVLGILLVSFTFEASGVAIDFLFGAAVAKQYSLFEVGSTVAKDRYDEVGLLGLEVVFLALAVVAPLVQLAALGSLFCSPLKIPGQQKLLNFCRVLDSWSSLDVAVVVLVISCFEFGTMAEFLVQKSGFAGGCDFIKDLTQQDCFAVKMTATGPMAILCLAGMLLVAVPKLMLRLTSDLLEKRVAAVGTTSPQSAAGKAAKLASLGSLSTAATGLDASEANGERHSVETEV